MKRCQWPYLRRWACLSCGGLDGLSTGVRIGCVAGPACWRVLPGKRLTNKKLETAFALIEANEYRVEGLESVVPALKELFATTLQRAVGDKQHRLRGMAASHIGVLQDLSVVPLLVKALEDDHAYVRSCAALRLDAYAPPRP